MRPAGLLLPLLLLLLIGALALGDPVSISAGLCLRLSADDRLILDRRLVLKLLVRDLQYQIK